MAEYALYKGEEPLSIGTVDEISAQLNISRHTVLYYGTEVYKQRLSRRKSKNARVLVRLEGDNDGNI